MMYVDTNRCDGCKACLDVCPAGAISLQSGLAVIDESLCTECRLCQDVCPQNAILLAEIVSSSAADITRLPSRQPARMPMLTKDSLRALVGPAIGSALLWTGREIVPRLAAIALRTLEIHIQNQASTTPTRPLDPNGWGGRRRGGQKRFRQRRRQHRNPSSQHSI
jgi:NAD-dependent dihydropyrimidine dehydrogenase PreA subunit